MDDTIKFKWLDIISKKEVVIVSTKNWLEAKFWSLAAVTISILTYCVNIVKTRFSQYKVFPNEVICPLIILFLLIWWLLFLLAYLYIPKSRKRLRSIVEYKRANLAAFISTLILLILHTYVFVYTKYLHLQDNTLLIPTTIFLLIVFYTGISLVKFSDKRESELKKTLANKNLGLAIFALTLSVKYFQSAHLFKVDIYDDVKLALLFTLIYFLINNAYETRVNIQSLPDLNEFQFSIISGRLKSEQEIIDKYEEIVLGKSALKWLKEQIASKKRDIIEKYFIEIIQLKHDIVKLSKMDDIHSEEYVAGYYLAMLSKSAYKVGIIIDRNSFVEKEKNWINEYNLTQEEASEIKEAIGKEVYENLDIEKSNLDEVEVMFNTLKVDEEFKKRLSEFISRKPKK